MSEKTEKPTSPRIREIKEEASKTKKPQPAADQKKQEETKNSKALATNTNMSAKDEKNEKESSTVSLFKMPSLDHVKMVCGNRCFALLYMIKKNIYFHAITKGMQEPYKISSSYKLTAEEKKYINEKMTSLGYQVLFKSVPPSSKTNETETKTKTEPEPVMTIEVHLDGE